MLRLFLFLVILSCRPLFAQTTVMKNGKEFFNGDDRHLRVYLNNNYNQLDPIEGIWIFTRFEYNEWGIEVSRTPNEFTAAIVRDPGNLRRAFVEINLNKAFCKEYQITYSIQTGGGSGYYPCEPAGCNVLSGQYYYDATNNTLSRPAIAFSGARAVLAGIKTFPQGPPTTLLPYPGGAMPADAGAQVTTRKPRVINHESGWEPYIDWGKQIFPSYILSMGTIDPKIFSVTNDYLGDPLSVVGVLIKNPKYNSTVTVEIEPTRYSKGLKETYTLTKKGEQYAIFPKISWDYDLLRCNLQATPLDFTFKLSINGKPAVSQTTTANLRAIDDCPLASYDYKGEKIDLKFMAAAFVNEGSPIVKNLTKEVREKGLMRDFTGLQAGEGAALQQVYAFWKILRDKGISYSSITNNGQQLNEEVLSQRIRLIEDVMDETQANCIDGTALFASCLSAVSIPPVLVFVPGHAFLGYVISYDKDGKPLVLYLETTMLGGTSSNIKPEYKKNLETEPYRTIREILYEKFNAGKKTSNDEVDYFLFATMSAFNTYAREIAENPEKMMVVNLDNARQLVKPIYRCAGSSAPLLSTTYKQGNTAPAPQGNRHSDGVIPAAPETVLTAAMKRKGTETYDNLEFMTEAPDNPAETFKVQIELATKFQRDKQAYVDLSPFGTVYAEYIIDKKLYRVMLGEFKDRALAQKAAQKAQSLGFNNVAVVRYKNGNRYESTYRDWKLLGN